MTAPRAEPAAAPQGPADADSHPPANSSSRESALPREVELLAKLFWTVPEAAFIARVGARTVWRLMADPDSGFPKARHVRGRTLLARDDVLAFLGKEAAR